MTPNGIKGQLKEIVGVSQVLVSPERGPALVVRPGSTDEVSRCLAVLNKHAIPVVTLGGRTGLVQGTDAARDTVGISTERLSKIHDLDPLRRQLLVDAGVTLEAVNRHAARFGLRYAVDFGARGSCTIGGTIATNAGGNSVVRFGMTRQNVVGIEAVLADGAILTDLRGLKKDNAGYDLKQIFIGSEGTLGVVTRALLSLVPAAADSASALIALQTLEDALTVMGTLQARCGQFLSALEIMWNRYFADVSRQVLKSARAPLQAAHPIYLLAQLETGARDPSPNDMFADILSGLDCIADSALAQTKAQEAVFWSIRDGSEIIERMYPKVLYFDVSLRPQDYSTYIGAVERTLAEQMPDAVPYYFGHLADGNVHFMIGHAGAAAEADAGIERCVYETLSRYQPSSISAEHGIGREKRAHLWRSRSAQEISTMNRIRAALDPTGILNPHIQYETAVSS